MGKCTAINSAGAPRKRQRLSGRRSWPAPEKLRLPRAMFVLFCLCSHGQSTSSSQTEIEARADSILKQMTIEEKIDLLGRGGWFLRGRCSQTGRAPFQKWRRTSGCAQRWPAHNYGRRNCPGGDLESGTGRARSAPKSAGMGPGQRSPFSVGARRKYLSPPMNGRNFEYLGEDPFLASRIAVGYIQGVQDQGVSATVKHFMGNNSEYDRHNTNSAMDERTMREIYLPVFEAAVREAYVGAIMDSYNLTNGAHMTQNDYLNTDVAKKEWGFNGIIMSDWTSTYDAVAAANGGLDLEMPSGAFLNRKNLKPALTEGRVSVATIDDKVRRILRVAARFGWLDQEQAEISIPRYNQQGRQAAASGRA